MNGREITLSSNDLGPGAEPSAAWLRGNNDPEKESPGTCDVSLISRRHIVPGKSRACFQAAVISRSSDGGDSAGRGWGWDLRMRREGPLVQAGIKIGPRYFFSYFLLVHRDSYKYDNYFSLFFF